MHVILRVLQLLANFEDAQRNKDSGDQLPSTSQDREGDITILVPSYLTVECVSADFNVQQKSKGNRGTQLSYKRPTYPSKVIKICSHHFTPEDYLRFWNDVVEEKCHSVKASCSNPTAAGSLSPVFLNNVIFANKGNVESFASHLLLLFLTLNSHAKNWVLAPDLYMP